MSKPLIIDIAAIEAAGNLPHWLSPSERYKNQPPKTLYVRRDVTNGADIVAWAKAQGFKTTLPADDMHVTIAYSKKPVDWSKFTSQDNEVRAANGGRSMKAFGDNGEAKVLRFESAALRRRWKEFTDAGASWDHDGFRPHITISWDADGIDLSKVEPYSGPIVLGPEQFEEIDEDWKDKITEKGGFDPSQPRDEHGRWADMGGLEPRGPSERRHVLNFVENTGDGGKDELNTALRERGFQALDTVDQNRVRAIDNVINIHGKFYPPGTPFYATNADDFTRYHRTLNVEQGYLSLTTSPTLAESLAHATARGRKVIYEVTPSTSHVRGLPLTLYKPHAAEVMFGRNHVLTYVGQYTRDDGVLVMKMLMRPGLRKRALTYAEALKYREDQQRDAHGRFADEGRGGPEVQFEWGYVQNMFNMFPHHSQETMQKALVGLLKGWPFKEKIHAQAGLYGGRMTVTFYGENVGEHSGSRIELFFSPSRVNQGIHLHIGLCDLRSSGTGEGAAKALLSNLLKFSEDNNVTDWSLTADITAGGYTWARFGFVPSRSSWADVRSALSHWLDYKQGHRPAFSEKALKLAKEISNDPEPTAIRRLVDMREGERKLGWEFMSRQSSEAMGWVGDIDLKKDKQSRDRLAYYSRRKKTFTYDISTLKADVRAALVWPLDKPKPPGLIDLSLEVLGDDISPWDYDIADVKKRRALKFSEAMKYREDQARDEHGRWTDTGAGGKEPELFTPNEMPLRRDPHAAISQADYDTLHAQGIQTIDYDAIDNETKEQMQTARPLPMNDDVRKQFMAVADAIKTIEQQPNMGQFVRMMKENVKFGVIHAAHRGMAAVTCQTPEGISILFNSNVDPNGWRMGANHASIFANRMIEEGRSEEEAKQESARLIWTHEIGHVLDISTGHQISKAVTAMLANASEGNFKLAMIKVNGEISNYAMHDPYEATAELLSMALSGERLPRIFQPLTRALREMRYGQ